MAAGECQAAPPATVEECPVSYGFCGAGMPQHFLMELVKHKARFEVTHVSYRACQPGLTKPAPPPARSAAIKAA
jgi:hypothetical protein